MQGVDLTGVDCSGFQVRGALLKGVRNLAGATLDNLRGAVLDGCDVRGVNLSGVDLSGALLKGVQNLAGATLDNLRGAVLDGCDVRGENLERCDLTGAWLRGAIGLSGLRFAGAHDFPAVRVDALQPGDVVVRGGALRVVRVREDYPGHVGTLSKVHFEEGQLWDAANTETVPCCQR
jgi:hypothetical protein